MVLIFCLLPSVTAFTLPQASSQRYEASRDSSVRLANEAARRGEELRRKWDLDGAETAFRQAVAFDPTNVTAALGLARIARVRFDYAAAIRLLGGANKNHPRSADLLTEYGEIYLAAEEAARAREYFESALKIDSSTEAAIIGRARVDLLERDYKSAEARLRALVARNPENSHAHAWLARALIESNRNRDAALEAERAIALDEYEAEALATLAFIRGTERKPDEVRAFARRAIALDPL
ncbi:MAG TPA: tetratricopeptide repeat protein, partial [Blastocatellia bacterium]|nr:tetratricopeptide repeat protein [Blastocatellia bacterium]